MATFGENFDGDSTPRALNYKLPPQQLDLVVSDDASAIAAVRALVPAAGVVALAETVRVVEAAKCAPHKVVCWGGGTEAEHALVRLVPAGLKTHWPLRVAIGEGLGPKCLGRFSNGHLEAFLVYHAPFVPRFNVSPRDDAARHTDAAARALAKVHAFRPPLHVLDVRKQNPAAWDELADLLRDAASPATGETLGAKWDGAAAAYAALDLANADLEERLLELCRRAPRGARITFCHNATARHALLRPDDKNVAFADFSAAGANYAALDLAHFLNDDAVTPPTSSAVTGFLSAYLAVVHNRPALSSDVGALHCDVAFFTVVDNYRRGLAGVLNAAACASTSRAAGLFLEATTRLRDARAQQYVLVW